MGYPKKDVYKFMGQWILQKLKISELRKQKKIKAILLTIRCTINNSCMWNNLLNIPTTI